VIVVVGDVQESALLTLVHQHYQQIAPQALPPEPTVPDRPQTAERRALFRKPVTTDKLLIGYKAPAFTDPDHLRLDFLSEVLMGGQSSAIYRDLVVDREICTSIGGSVTPFRSPGLWEVGASLQRGHTAEEVLGRFDEHLDRILRAGIADIEVERTRARLLTEFYSGLRTAHGKAAQLGEYETTAGDYRELFAVPAALRAVTAADLLAVAKRYLVAERRTVLIARPKTEPRPGKKRPGAAEQESADA
jgi:zinc protease